MAKLTPNSTYYANGVKVNEKIIPDGTRWKSSSKAVKAGFSANSLYKKQQKLNKGSGIPLYVTVHNTDDLKNVCDDGEQYTRATYNENMGSVRVHYYVDDECAWQNLKAGCGMVPADPKGSAEVSWHAGDGSTASGGNMNSLSVEIIMNDTKDHDAKAYDNGAKLVAWLLWKHKLPLSNLVSHTYWVNKSSGKHFEDVDEQCVNLIKDKKWCPFYIFASYDHTTAFKNWMKFKSTVSSYLNKILKDQSELSPPEITFETKAISIKQGDLVKLSASSVYYNGTNIPNWVKTQNWYVSSISGDRVIINENEFGTNKINSPINIKFLTVIKSKENIDNTFTPYLVKITTDSLNIRKGAGTKYAKVGQITDRGVYTIIEERTASNGCKWGKLKSGAGWVSLAYTKKL